MHDRGKRKIAIEGKRLFVIGTPVFKVDRVSIGGVAVVRNTYCQVSQVSRGDSIHSSAIFNWKFAVTVPNGREKADGSPGIDESGKWQCCLRLRHRIDDIRIKSAFQLQCRNMEKPMCTATVRLIASFVFGAGPGDSSCRQLTLTFLHQN